MTRGVCRVRWGKRQGETVGKKSTRNLDKKYSKIQIGRKASEANSDRKKSWTTSRLPLRWLLLPP
jgi:hypothetical protein